MCQSNFKANSPFVREKRRRKKCRKTVGVQINVLEMDSIRGNGAKNLVFSNHNFITLISMVKYAQNCRIYNKQINIELSYF